VVSNLATTSENLSASRSRILDADFAAETANLSRAQILQQAGTAMLGTGQFAAAKRAFAAARISG
jgi:flagellin